MQSSSLFSETITENWARELAGVRFYERGLVYFCTGQVLSLKEQNASIRSIVRGSVDYTVRFAIRANTVSYACDCPIGSDGDFCKHCVATALAWLKSRAAHQDAPVEETSGKTTEIDVVAFLKEQKKATLVKLLLAWADKDQTLQQHLLLLAARKEGTDKEAAEVRKALEKAIRIRGYLEYREVRNYATVVDGAIDKVEALLGTGDGGSVMEMCEMGVRSLANAAELADTSDGYFTALMGRLEDLHFLACLEVKPEPEALAKRLFEMELGATSGEWNDCVQTYEPILGEKGVAAFSREAAAAWANVPAQTGGPNRDERSWALSHIVENLAARSGDVEQLVDVISRDLSSAFAYLRIARLYREASRYGEAMAWAAKGLAAGFDDRELRLFIAEEHQRSGLPADALRMVWQEFRKDTGLASYQRLELFAKQNDEWDEWRTRAIASIRRDLAEEAATRRAGGDFFFKPRHDHSVLVEIYCYEQRIEEAWVEAQTGDCASQLWEKLAAAREEAHPQGSAEVYLRLAERAIELAPSNRYDAAVALLEKAADLSHKAANSVAFEQALEALRLKHKAKRNLQAAVEKRKKHLYLGPPGVADGSTGFAKTVDIQKTRAQQRSSEEGQGFSRAGMSTNLDGL